MLAGVDTFLVHIVQHGGKAFAFHRPAHMIQIFPARAGAIHIGRAGTAQLEIGEGGRPHIAGHVAGFHIGLGDEGANRAAVRVTVHADPGSLAAAGKKTRPGVAVCLFHIHQIRADAPGLGNGIPGAGRAHVGIEHLAGSGICGEQTAHIPRSGHHSLCPDYAEGGFITGNIQRQHPGHAFGVAEHLQHRGMIQNLHPALSGLLGKHLFLVMSVVLQKNARTPGVGMPLKVIIPGGLHVDAPIVPHVHDFRARFQKAHHQRSIVAGGVLAVHEFLIHHADVAVLLRNPAQKMVIARRARAAALRIGLVQKDDLRALVRRRNGGHKSGYASADHGNVGVQLFFQGNHGEPPEKKSWSKKRKEYSAQSSKAKLRGPLSGVAAMRVRLRRRRETCEPETGARPHIRSTPGYPCRAGFSVSAST